MKRDSISRLALAVVLTVAIAVGLFSSSAADYTSPPIDMKVGNTEPIEFQDGTINSMTSSDPSGLEVTGYSGSNGSIKALRAGSYTLLIAYAKTDGTVDNITVPVSVTEGEAQNNNDNFTTSITLAIGQTHTTSAYASIAGSMSENPAIASVTNNTSNQIVITGVAQGTTVIRFGAKTSASDASDITYTVNVTVTGEVYNQTTITPNPTPTPTVTPTSTEQAATTQEVQQRVPLSTRYGTIDLRGTYANISLTPGNKLYRLKDILLGGNPIEAANLRWLSTDPSVFTVDPNTGLFKPISQGSAYLVAVDQYAQNMTSVTIYVNP